jgi:aspartyl aminopeptidase
VKTDAGFERQLLHIKRPLLRVPNLCIHLQSPAERASFSPNKEQHLQPIISMVEEQLNGSDDDAGGAPDERHAPELLKIIAQELGCSLSAIQDFELTMCDTQPGAIWGLKNEFLSSPRLDNQVHCYTSMRALIDQGDISADEDVSMIALFDHEEVGSQSAVGACSPVMKDAIERIGACLGAAPGDESYHVSIQRSFCMSADVAHAVHPNYATKHEKMHSPLLNKGTVIKTNDNQRYATNAATGFLCRELARQAGVGIQEFMVANDCPCGTTIGPIVAATTGIRTVDLGVPSLSMHSIRETVGVVDIMNSYLLFKCFFERFRELDNSCSFL